MKPNDEAIKAAATSLFGDYNDAEKKWVEEALTAAYAAQFKSEDYAGLIERLQREPEMDVAGHKSDACLAADALETLLAERTEIGACEGCGSTKTLEELRAAGHLSCCPERKMLSASEWKSRADNAEDELTRLRADLAAVTAERDRMREALKRIDGMATAICMTADAGYGMSVETVMPIYETARAAIEGVKEPQQSEGGK